MFGSVNYKYAIIGVIAVSFFFLFFAFKRLKKINLDFDKRLEFDDKDLSDDQKKIIEKYGYPLKTQFQESVDGNGIIMWIYPENIISFNEKDKTVRKII
jgi:hypothetical protein